MKKVKKGGVNGREQKRHLFSFLLLFPSLPSPSSLVFAPVTQTTTQAIVKPIYSLWHDCDLSAVLQGSGRRTLVDLFYQDDQFMNSGNAFVQDSYSEKVS